MTLEKRKKEKRHNTSIREIPIPKHKRDTYTKPYLRRDDPALHPRGSSLQKKF
jgi:hypothetical protein